MDRALEDVRVADFSQMMQGPWATQKLADMGADVIKIERIGGEWERTLPAGGELLNGVSPFFLAMNRNKRSIELNLKADEGRSVALDIIADSDVLIENFRPGVMDRLGLGYEDVREVNESIIYVSASGFGSDGPYVDRPGQDLLLQAMSGLARYTGRKEDPPTPAGTAIVDEHGATLIALNTMFALFHKERTGEGQRVEANLLNSALDLQCQELTANLNQDIPFDRSREGIAQAWLGGAYGICETANGFVAIAMAPLDVIADLFDEDRLTDFDSQKDEFEHRDEIKRLIEAHTREFETDELLERFLNEDIWAAPIQDHDDLREDPQVAHNNILVDIQHPEGGQFTTVGIPVRHSKTPGEIVSPPPKSGQHSQEVLRDLGYDESEIRRLEADGVTGEISSKPTADD